MKLLCPNEEFSVCTVRDYSMVDLDAEYCFTGKTPEEKSLVCAAEAVPSNVLARGRLEMFKDRGSVGFWLGRHSVQAHGSVGELRHTCLCGVYFHDRLYFRKEGKFSKGGKCVTRIGI